jgi:4a-hydroxytetrahydrobiopterin dehydratase
MAVVEQKALQEWITRHPRWILQDDAIHAQGVFADFVTAFSFLTAVALLAEKHDHHPKIENVYNRVMLTLNTHDAGNKVTDKDLKLAEAMESLWK